PIEKISKRQFKEMICKRTSEVAGIFEDNQINAFKNIKDTQKWQKTTHDRKI
ncbi:8969_t:CDS:1, partial [Dentiscutata erythropus]